MNETLEKLLINLIPIKEWRRIIRDRLSEKTNPLKRVAKQYFGSNFFLVKTLEPIEENCSFAEDTCSFYGVKFSKMKNLYGILECFGRRDYEFGGMRNCVFIDVGANIGDSALYAATLDCVDKIYAYEPFKITYDAAQKNISLNPDLGKKINLYNFGWGEENETLRVSSVNDINLSAINTVEEFFRDSCNYKRNNSENIEIKKASEVLGEILSENPSSEIVLKIDIEGAEYGVIKELHKFGILGKVRFIIMEWHYKGYDSLVKLLGDFGFVWFNERFDNNIGLIRAVRIK